MTLSVTTLAPSTDIQDGLWTRVGAASSHAALSDGVNTSYLQTTVRARTDTEVARVGFPTLTLPAGSKIFSVSVRVTSQTVTYPAPQPQCVHHIRCSHGQGIITTIILAILKWLFGFLCPQTPTDPATGQPQATAWLDQVVATYQNHPDGSPWTVANFNPFEYAMGRDDTTGNALRHSEVRVDITYAQQSTVTVTGPTGTVTATSRPTVTWTYASPQSDPQLAYQVAIYTAAQVAAGGFAAFVTVPAQSSGWVLSDATAWTLGTDIVNGTWYAYVQLRQQWDGIGTYDSPVASTSWVQSIVGAPDPVVIPAPPPSAAGSAVYEPATNRVRIDFAPSSASPTTVAFRVETSRDSGITWGPVRGYALVAASGMSTVSAYDYEAPLNVPSQYRVLAYGQVSGQYYASANYSSVLTATPVTTACWLKDPLNPGLGTVFPIASVGDAVTRQRAQGVFRVLSGGASANKIVVNGPQYGVEGTYTLQFSTRDPVDYWAAFQALDATGRTLLVQYPHGEQHYIKFGPGSVGQDMQSTYDVNLQQSKRRYTFCTVSYTEVEMPEITS